MNWVSGYLGWLIGTEAHCGKIRELKRPKQQRHESDVEYAKSLITYEDKFNRSYRSRAYVKRVLLALLVIMALTNPGFEKFTAYQLRHYDVPANVCHKKNNFFFFSTYGAMGHTFIGALTTFFALSAEERLSIYGISKQDSVYLDTAAGRDTIKKLAPIIIPNLDTGANHNAARMDSVLRENAKPNPFAQQDTATKF